jgi:hypothetical protein
MRSWCLGMLKGCLVYSSMRLGVPFIALRQLGAIESILGRQFLPSVAWRTGQSGAPPDTVRCGFVTPRILQLNFFFSLLAKIRALPFLFLFPLARP